MIILAFSLNATKYIFQQVPLVYVFNDRDFQGRDGSDSTSQYVSTVNAAYRTAIPNYINKTFPNNPIIGVQQKFIYGNILFLVTDSRSFLSLANGTIFGTDQTNWLITELTNAASNSTIQAIFITITQPWNYVASAYEVDFIKQSYISLISSMVADKVNIGNTINNINFNLPNSPNFKSVMLIVGEHHLAFDNGNWNNYGNFPIAVCGPLDFWQQCRGGPYSHGSYHDSINQYCQFNVYQNAANNTCIIAKGFLTTDVYNAVEETVFIYDTCNPYQYPARSNIKCPIDYTEKILNAGITVAATLFVYLVFYVIIYKVAINQFSFTKIKVD